VPPAGRHAYPRRPGRHATVSGAWAASDSTVSRSVPVEASSRNSGPGSVTEVARGGAHCAGA
jgi:hypothetical protein